VLTGTGGDAVKRLQDFSLFNDVSRYFTRLENLLESRNRWFIWIKRNLKTHFGQKFIEQIVKSGVDDYKWVNSRDEQHLHFSSFLF
jgi:hypothetical protein